MVWSLLALGAGTSDLAFSPSTLMALTPILVGLLALVVVRRATDRARRLSSRSTAVRVHPGATPHGLVPVPQLRPDAPGRPRPRAPSTR